MKALAAGACVVLLAYAAMRAADVPFTYDEAASYIRYVDTRVPSVFETNSLSIFNFEVATNHFLNTLLTRLVYLAGGRSEFVLRLPNLLGYAMYLCFAFLILQRVTTAAMVFAGVLLLNLNPYVLEFFALSRGYGLSVGFLMGAVFFLLRFLERLGAGGTATRDLPRALAFGCASVLANFALLNVYISVLALAVVALVVFNRQARQLAAAQVKGTDTRVGRAVPHTWLAAALFIPLVLSQDVALSDSLYEPVTISLAGLDRAALDRVKILRLDLRGRESPLARDLSESVWRSSRHTHVRALRIELPRDVADTLARIETVIGTHVFTFDPRRTDGWTTREAGATRVFESAGVLSLPRSRMPGFRPVINWAGDKQYATRLAVSTLGAFGILMSFALLLRLLGWIAVRAGLLTADDWRPLGSSVLWVAALAGAPLYLLKRNAELYFGGTRGLIDDTFHSIVESSFYGRTYSSVQIQAVFACLAATFALFCVALTVRYRRRRVSTLVPAMSILAILLTTSLSLVVQRFLFQTVYLVGRTALFYVPLSILFFVFAWDAVAELGRAWRAVATSIVATAVLLATYHFATTANLKYARDWPDDASTREMVDDLEQFADQGPRQASRVTLGVETVYAPVAVYYARRSAASIDVIVIPSARHSDFLYLQEGSGHLANAVARYPFTHTALVRVNH